MTDESWLDRHHLRHRMQQLDEAILYEPDPQPSIPWYQRSWVYWAMIGLILLQAAMTLYTRSLDTTLYQKDRDIAVLETKITYLNGMILGQSLTLCPGLQERPWPPDFLDRAARVQPTTCEDILQLLTSIP